MINKNSRIFNRCGIKNKIMSWKRYREGQKPDIGIEVLAYHEDWVNPDFAPDGVRVGFINGDGNFVSAYWWDHQDDYIAISKDRCEDKPDFFKNHISNTEPQYWKAYTFRVFQR